MCLSFFLDTLTSFDLTEPWHTHSALLLLVLPIGTDTMVSPGSSHGGQNADTRNPPDVHHNTHIISVLGVCDLGHQRRDSPQRDGWMVPDFYLWMSVLEGMGKSQSWLTCENPHSLLAKYGSQAKTLNSTNDKGAVETAPVAREQGYIYGGPFEERVLVLSENTAGDLAKRMTLSNHGTSLREDFLRCVEEKCKTAEAADDSVLLMGFCHGDDGDSTIGGLCVGTNPGSGHEEDFPRTSRPVA